MRADHNTMPAFAVRANAVLILARVAVRQAADETVGGYNPAALTTQAIKVGPLAIASWDSDGGQRRSSIVIPNHEDAHGDTLNGMEVTVAQWPNDEITVTSSETRLGMPDDVKKKVVVNSLSVAYNHLLMALGAVE